MGIKWLTSYVADIQRSISAEVTFPEQGRNDAAGSSDSNEPAPTFVVDAWAFIFRVWLTRFGDAIRGQDMQAYKQVVIDIVQAWAAAGIHSVFVFDGPMLPVKLPCLIERRARVAACNQAYMKSSAQSRASRRFQSDCGVVPPTLLFATIDALRQAGATSTGDVKIGQSSTAAEPQSAIQIVFAPTEADSLVAEIAASKPRGYAVSQDSDYFVLCARGRGTDYVPLESIEYLVQPPAKQPSAASAAADGSNSVSANSKDTERDAELAAALARGDIQDTADLNDGFEQVTTRKRGGRRQQSAAVVPAAKSTASTQALRQYPPLKSEEESIGKAVGVRIRAYRSHDLATHLQLSPTLLPLLAALIGNDYSSALQTQILLKHVWGSQRVTLAANILREEWIRVKGGVGSRLGKRDASRSSSVQTRRGNGRNSAFSSPRPGADDDDARSDMGSSATATPTARSIAASTPFDPVRTLVEAVVDRGLTETINHTPGLTHVATGERAKIIDSVIEGAAAYSLLSQSDAPHLASPSALFFGEQTAALIRHGSVNGDMIIAHPKRVALYRAAYEQGRFHPLLIEAMTQRICINPLLPEAAESASVQKTTARTLRAWIYAILFEAWGMHWAREQWQEPIAETVSESDDDDSAEQRRPPRFGPDRTYREGEMPDDVISVHTESSESGEETGDEDEDLPSRPASVNDFRLEADEAVKPAPGVNEYARAGSSYNGQLVRIHPLATLLRYGTGIEPDFDERDAPAEKPQDISEALPASLAEMLSGDADTDASTVLLMPSATRLDLYWHAHEAATPAIRALPSELWLVASALRLLLVHAADRVKTNAARARDNWSKSELGVAVQSALAAQQKAKSRGQASGGDSAPSDTALASARAIHLGSTLQLVVQTSAMLAQALLLTVQDDADDGTIKHSFSTETLAHPENAFDGPIFYEGMARIHDGVDDEDGEGEESRSTQANKLTGLSAAHAKIVAQAVDAITEGLVDSLGIDALDLKRERKAKKRLAREQKVAGTNGTATQGTTEENAITKAATKPARSGNSSAAQKRANAFALLDGMAS